MSNRTLYILTAILLACIAILFGIRFVQMFQGNSGRGFISLNDVRGSDVTYNSLPYTLSFKQQTELLTYLNNSSPATTAKGSEPSPISAITIYRFEGQPDIIITPLGYVEGNLLFSTPLWNGGSPLIEESEGQLKKLLSKVYDPT